jgi:hypothetical protein
MEAKLNELEEKELREGQSLYEMTKTPGFEVLKGWFEDMAFHSWVDPREIEGDNPKETWQWRELVAWAGANNAREILEKIQSTISRSEYLEKKKSGEIVVERMTIQ